MKKLLILLLFIVCNWAVLLFAQDEIWMIPAEVYEFYETSTDAKSLALGQTSLLNSTAGSYLYDNPAMLGKLTKSYISFAFLIASADDKYTFTVRDQYNSVMEYTEKGKYSNPTRYLPLTISTYIKTKKHNNIGLSIGYRKLYDYSYDRKEKFYQYKYERNFDGGVNFLTVGTGTKIMKNLYAGFNYNLAINNSNNYKYRKDDFYNAFWYTEDSSEKIKGMFTTFTLYGNLLPQVETSISVRPAYKLKYELELEARNSANQSAEYVSSYSVKNPAKYTIGVNLKPSKLIDLCFQWNNVPLKEYKVDFGNTSYDLYNKKSLTGHNLRFGCSLNTKYPLRIGYFVDNIPYYNQEVVNNGLQAEIDNAPVALKGLIFGSGFKGRRFTLDVAYALIDTKYDTCWNSEEDGQFYPASYEYSGSKVLVTLEYGF